MPDIVNLIKQVEGLVYNNEGPFPAVFEMRYVPNATPNRFMWKVIIQTDDRTSTASGTSLGETLEQAVSRAHSEPVNTEEGLSARDNYIPDPMTNAGSPSDPEPEIFNA